MDYDDDFPGLDPGHAMLWYWSWLWRWLRSWWWWWGWGRGWMAMTSTMLMLLMIFQMMLWTMPRFEHFAWIHWVLPRANAETFQLPKGVFHHESLSSQGTFFQYLLSSQPRFCCPPWAAECQETSLRPWCPLAPCGQRIDGELRTGLPMWMCHKESPFWHTSNSRVWMFHNGTTFDM